MKARMERRGSDRISAPNAGLLLAISEAAATMRPESSALAAR
jgi:hypothetical protein